MTQAFHQIPVARPVLDEKEALAAQRVVLSGWVTQGPEVAAFEREFAELVGAPFACAVSNCTTALHLALMAAGIGQDDEVITVSHSFIATANAIRYCGATPVFVDVEAQGFNIDPNLIEAAITPRTKAILCVHQLGMPCDLSRIVAIGRQRSIPVIEDAACATGSEILWNGQWEKIGSPRGDIACFSFHPRKVITTGDGGMLTTGNADYDRQFRLWRQHGMSVTDAVRHGSKSVIYENYDVVGYNYRMTDLQAAIGREQLRRLPDIIAARRRIADQYAERLHYVDGITPPVEPQWARSNWQSYGVELPPWADQRATMQALLDQGISTRRGIMNSHLEKAYSSPGSCRVSGSLQHSSTAQSRAIILPLFAQMTQAEVSIVIETLADVVGRQGLRMQASSRSPS